MNLDEAAQAFREFVAIVQALRTPGTGCPWDLEQDHRTLRLYLVEETYETLDAIDRDDDSDLREELGDLLLQVALHSQIAADRDAFSITEVIRGIAEKMVRRHPHVFAATPVSGSAEVVRNWDRIKAAEAHEKGIDPKHADLLGRLPEGLPALVRSQRLGERAAKVAYDWTPLQRLLDQMQMEYARLSNRLRTLGSALPAAKAVPTEETERLTDELRGLAEHDLGDFLFTLCQVARRLGLSADDSLRTANNRFIARFRRMEEQAIRPLHEMTAPELQAAWQKAETVELTP